MFDIEGSVKFSHNWNGKLSNRIFATIRKYEKDKAAYYEGLVNKRVAVQLDQVPFCTAKVLTLEERVFGELPKAFVMQDTGQEYAEACKTFKGFGIEEKTQVLIPAFKRQFP